MPLDSVTQLVTLNIKDLESNELARRVQRGCNDSATELSNRFTPRLLTLIERRLSGRRSDAEDLVQEALARAFQRLDQFNSEFKFSTWLYTIAIRMCTDYLRRESRRPKSISLDQTENVREANLATSANASDDLTENIWSLAKNHLNETQFTILWLKYAESLSVQEIAQIIGKTQIGVRVHLHRSREKLGRHLMCQDGDPLTNRQRRGLP